MCKVMIWSFFFQLNQKYLMQNTCGGVVQNSILLPYRKELDKLIHCVLFLCPGQCSLTIWIDCCVLCCVPRYVWIRVPQPFWGGVHGAACGPRVGRSLQHGLCSLLVHGRQDLHHDRCRPHRLRGLHRRWSAHQARPEEKYCVVWERDCLRERERESYAEYKRVIERVRAQSSPRNRWEREKEDGCLGK